MAEKERFVARAFRRITAELHTWQFYVAELVGAGAFSTAVGVGVGPWGGFLAFLLATVLLAVLVAVGEDVLASSISTRRLSLLGLAILLLLTAAFVSGHKTALIAAPQSPEDLYAQLESEEFSSGSEFLLNAETDYLKEECPGAVVVFIQLKDEPIPNSVRILGEWIQPTSRSMFDVYRNIILWLTCRGVGGWPEDSRYFVEYIRKAKGNPIRLRAEGDRIYAGDRLLQEARKTYWIE